MSILDTIERGLEGTVQDEEFLSKCWEPVAKDRRLKEHSEHGSYGMPKGIP
jgi:hypothetical protein